MPGPRQPLAVIAANGRKHLSQREIAERSAVEVTAVADGPVPPPSWLTKVKLRQEFERIEKRLRELKIFDVLDADTLAMFLAARDEYVAARRQADKALREKNVEAADEWSRVQDRYFKQARACASDLGLTVTSRCRLTDPEKPQQDEDNPFVQMVEARRA